MKDVPIEELAAINAEIHEAAVRVGCTQVSLTGLIWPGGRIGGGSGEEAARFIEYSWLRAASVGGRAIFEETDPKAFAALLAAYGLEGDPDAEALPERLDAVEEPTATAPPPEKVALAIEVLPATKLELDRQAAAAGLSPGEFLDVKFSQTKA